MSISIKIQAFKYPNFPHYEWEGELVEATDDYVLVLCQPKRKLIHHSKNKVFTMDNLSLEFFSLKEHFTVSMSIEEGKIVSYYCNVALPSHFKNNTVQFIDLDLDLVKRKFSDWQVVDEDEFIENSFKYRYPHELIEKAESSLKDLLKRVTDHTFPFDGSLLSKIIH